MTTALEQASEVPARMWLIRLHQRNQFVRYRLGKFRIVDVVIKFKQLRFAMIRTHVVKQRLPRHRIVKGLAFAIDRRNALQRKQDRSWTSRRRNLPPRIAGLSLLNLAQSITHGTTHVPSAAL